MLKKVSQSQSFRQCQTGAGVQKCGHALASRNQDLAVHEWDLQRHSSVHSDIPFAR